MTEEADFSSNTKSRTMIFLKNCLHSCLTFRIKMLSLADTINSRIFAFLSNHSYKYKTLKTSHNIPDNKLSNNLI